MRNRFAILAVLAASLSTAACGEKTSPGTGGVPPTPGAGGSGGGGLFGGTTGNRDGGAPTGTAGTGGSNSGGGLFGGGNRDGGTPGGGGGGLFPGGGNRDGGGVTQPPVQTACGAFTPCGGSVVGTWNVRGVCSPPEQDPDCPGAVIDLANAQWQGSFAFSANMTYQVNMTISGGATMTFPLSCLDTAQPVTCTELAAALTQLWADDPEVPFAGATCTGAGTCNCQLPFKAGLQNTDNGTYTAAGSMLTTMSATGDINQRDFCVAGAELKIRTLDAMGSLAEMLTLGR